METEVITSMEQLAEAINAICSDGESGLPEGVIAEACEASGWTPYWESDVHEDIVCFKQNEDGIHYDCVSIYRGDAEVFCFNSESVFA